MAPDVRIASVQALLVALVLAAPLPVHGTDGIGSFRVHGGTLASARAVFGAPSSMRQEHGGGAVTWPGLKIRFYTLLHDRQCRTDSSFESAEVSRPWRTDRGLRQGGTVSRARSLYPKARTVRRTFGPTALGLAVRFSPAIGDYGLAARTLDGKVTTLVLLDPQGGE